MRKRVLITGKDSYVGSMFCSYTTEYGYTVDTVDMIGDGWKSEDFSSYDAIIHVAAIVHRRECDCTREESYAINTQLAYDVALKAKQEGVKQFVFLSTMSVYGMVTGVITDDTNPCPANLYGETKLEAEKLINTLCDDNFTVTILRPPIVYGKGCRGNYVALSYYAKKLPFFPDFDSQRSMLYIDNLSAFIKKAIDENLCGMFCPQDDEYVCTSEMVKKIAEINGSKIKMTKIFNPLIRLLLKCRVSIVCKVFGSLTYDKSLCPQFEKTDFSNAVRLSEQSE